MSRRLIKRFEYRGVKFSMQVFPYAKVERRLNGDVMHSLHTTSEDGGITYADFTMFREIEDVDSVVKEATKRAESYIDMKLDNSSYLNKKLESIGFNWENIGDE